MGIFMMQMHMASWGGQSGRCGYAQTLILGHNPGLHEAALILIGPQEKQKHTSDCAKSCQPRSWLSSTSC